MSERVVVGMSGGVDSSVAALLMVERGYEVIGMTADLLGRTTGGRCCSLSSTNDARRVCDKLGIPHYTVNMREVFNENVKQNFHEYYRAGLTPNPCITCNRTIKFDAMLDKALDLSADYLVTGHYARVEDREGGRVLAEAEDASKDQTYFLACLTPEQISRVKFPVGEFEKTEVREIAEDSGLITADKPDSQDVCFLEDYDDRSELFADEFDSTGRKGEIITHEGEVLGEHDGIENFTIGQRKIGVSAGERVYVYKIDPETQRVYVGPRDLLPVERIELDGLNEITPGNLQEGRVYPVQTRYRQEPSPGRLEFTEDETPAISFLEPVEAVAKGQWAVIRRGDTVLGGEEITAVENAEPLPELEPAGT